MFEKGISQSEADKEHNENCYSGIARCSLKIGDIRKQDSDFNIKIFNRK